MIETIGRLPGLFEKLALLRNWNGEGDVAQIVSSNNMKKYHRRDGRQGTLVRKVLDNPCSDVRSICYATTSKVRCPRGSSTCYRPGHGTERNLCRRIRPQRFR